MKWWVCGMGSTAACPSWAAGVTARRRETGASSFRSVGVEGQGGCLQAVAEGAQRGAPSCAGGLQDHLGIAVEHAALPRHGGCGAAQREPAPASLCFIEQLAQAVSR